MSGDLTARDVVAETIDEYLFRFHGVTSSLNQADAFMQWLCERGYDVVERLERDDRWEWGREAPGDWTDVTEWGAGPEAQGNAEADWEENGGTIIRRRPAGEWEVAP